MIYTSTLTLSGANSGSAVISVDSDANFAIVGISGDVNGAPITGLSTFNGADNLIVPLQNRQFVSFVVSQPGFSFSAGGINYNVFNASGISSAEFLTNSLGQTFQTGVEYVGGYIAPPAVCFVTGSRILTVRGEIAVEDLEPGDIAVTSTGATRPIQWIGRREISGEALHRDAQPFRIEAGAFGDGLPHRPLYLSPGHPVLIGAAEDGTGGVLVPIMCLENGTSIRREARAAVTFWHVELDAHDVLLAEGLPAESYIDGGDRAFFAEASDHVLHNPDFVPAGWDARCRPVVVDGPLVEAERLRLDALFAASLDRHSAWPSGEIAL